MEDLCITFFFVTGGCSPNFLSCTHGIESLVFWFGLKLKPRPRIHKSKKLGLSGNTKPC